MLKKEEIPEQAYRRILMDLRKAFRETAVAADLWHENPRAHHVFLTVWDHSLDGRPVRVGQIAKESGMPRQTLQQGKTGLLPKLADEGWLERIGRSQYAIPDCHMLKTTTPGPNGEPSPREIFEEAVHKAHFALLALKKKQKSPRKPKGRPKS